MGIDYICTAVAERRPFVMYLEDHIPNLQVVWDKNKDPMETFTRAWKTYPDKPSLRLQDDLILCEGFLSKAHAVIQKHPNSVIQFFSMRTADIQTGTRWENGSNWIGNLCHYLPAGMAGEIYEFSKTWKRKEEHPTADDLLMADYFKENKIKYLLHCPNLVDHAEVYSVINRSRSKYRKSKTFVNPEYKHFPLIKDFSVRMKYLDIDDFTEIE
jgi:hypothetical protein